MRSFILSLLTVILIEPCLAQMAGNNSGTTFHFQSLNNERFEEGFITSFEKADLPFQIKTIPITRQARLIVEAIGNESALPNIKKDYLNEFIKGRVYVVGPGNGGGGAFYHSGAIGKQAWANQSQQAVKLEAYGYNLQGQEIEIDPNNLNLTAWKALTLDNDEYFAQSWDIVSQTGLEQPRIKMTQTELKTIILEYINATEKAYFEKEAVQASLFRDNTWSHYGENIQAILQEIIEENTNGSIDDFYKLDIPAQNGLIYIVGLGNGGGGTYMLRQK